MSVKENKALIRRIYDLWNKKELSAVSELYTPRMVHTNDREMSLEQENQFNDMFFRAFPDAIATIEDMVAEGDKVAIRVTWRGTHRSDFSGITPTGNKIEMTNTAIFRIASGKVVENWATTESLRFLQQLGVIPKQYK